MEKWDGKERRNSERRADCYFPYCGSGVEIKNAHEQMMNILSELKDGQETILRLSTEHGGVLANIQSMKEDIDYLKEKMEEKLNRKDAILWGVIAGGIMSLIQAAIYLHSVIK